MKEQGTDAQVPQGNLKQLQVEPRCKLMTKDILVHSKMCACPQRCKKQEA